MFKHLNQSLNEAFRLLEDDEELGVVDATPYSDEEEIPEPSTEERIENLENEINEIKTILENPDMPPATDDFTSSTGVAVSPRDAFEDSVYECFMNISKCPKDVELTEEFLDKRPYSNCWIPQVASRKKMSRNEVRNILLNRQKGNNNEN